MAEERVQRRLAAFLAADLVGYDRLTGVDEEGTLARLEILRDEIIDPAIVDAHGRIVKTMGGFLIEFPSCVDAVRCAIAIHSGMAIRRSESESDQGHKIDSDRSPCVIIWIIEPKPSLAQRCRHAAGPMSRASFSPAALRARRSRAGTNISIQ